MAVIIGIIPAIIAFLQEASRLTIAKYYLYTVIIVIILWLVIKRITKSKEAI
jgi:hypothetical protein